MVTEILRPNGSGDLNEIRYEVGAASPNHYLNVNEVIHDDAASMVYDHGGGMYYDLYTLTNPTKEGIIEKIELLGWFMSEIASENWLTLHEPDFSIKTGGTKYDYEVCARVAGAQEANVWTEQTNENEYAPLTTNPKTGLAWTKSDLEALQLGCGLMRPQFSSMQQEYCTQLYVVVHYTYVYPNVTTGAASAVGSGVATLNGTLEDDGGEPCDVRFQYGLTDAYETPTEWQTGKITNNTFEQEIGGLIPNTIYYFRAQAKNSVGTVSGAPRTFTTLVAAPEVSTDEASEVGQELANINGTLDNDGGEACECYLEWGRTKSYGTTIQIGSKTTGETFSQEISGLTPNTEYHFRAFATNSAGTSYGDDVMFTTKQRPLVNYRPIVNRSYALSRHEV